ncbi:MAG: Asp-tRNA(Asn)/Glu-tRNA(Gln) amidotransferase subunit GatC [Chitinophagales bacterium]
MEIDDKLVEKLAKLSKLEIAAEEKTELKANFGKIIDLVDKLQEINTDGVEPLIYLTENKNILRKDVVENMVDKVEALKNAPDKDSDYFKVPKVLKK